MDDQPPLVAMVAKSLLRTWVLSPCNPLSRPMVKESTDLLHFISSNSFTFASWLFGPVPKIETSFTTVLFFSASRISTASHLPVLDSIQGYQCHGSQPLSETCHSGLFYSNQFQRRSRCRYQHHFQSPRFRCCSWWRNVRRYCSVMWQIVLVLIARIAFGSVDIIR